MEDTEKRFIEDGLRDLAIHHKLIAPSSDQAPYNPAPVLLGHHEAPQYGAEGQYANVQSYNGDASPPYNEWDWPESASSAQGYSQIYEEDYSYQWEGQDATQPYYDDPQWNDPYYQNPPQDSYSPPQQVQNSYPTQEEKVFFADEYTSENYQEDAYEEEAAKPPSPDHVYDAEYGW
jgi:hypothetical protein